MEALITKLLELGPIAYLTVVSLLLNVGLLIFIRKLWDMTIALTREVVSALAVSSEVNKAGNESRDELVQLASDHHLAQMLSLAKLESLLAAVRAWRSNDAA